MSGKSSAFFNEGGFGGFVLKSAEVKMSQNRHFAIFTVKVKRKNQRIVGKTRV